MILLENVKKIYRTKQNEVTAVDDVNLHIEEGEIFGIIGYSGAGKSSLIRLLNQLEKPTSGTVKVGNRLLSAAKGKELRQARQEIGMIFQHFNLLWSRTVSENIAFPLEIAGVPKETMKKRVQELVEMVGLSGREDAYPSQLSGGQKQRVGIARALANNPKILLCDEATSALDPETTDSILELLLEINKKIGLTIVLITHEMHVIQKICTRVAVMESGKIVEMGNVLDIFKNPKQQITKRFVQQIVELEDTEETMKSMMAQYPNGQVLKLTFVKEKANQPIITSIIRKFHVDVNIIQGQINQTPEGPYGTLFVHIVGTEEEISAAIDYIRQQEVEMEVMSNDKSIS